MNPNSRGKTRPPRERNSILKKYYGLSPSSDQNQQQQQQQQQSSPTNSMNIDDPTFDSLKYFAKLVKEQSLGGLMNSDNILVGEMREIDGDMKTLVYENYNKFISATDTIRKMKSNVENMESEMSRLDQNMQAISQQCNNVNQGLESNRAKIQQLGNIHNQLQRLQFIFELPNRLESCLDTKHYSQAVKYYSRAKKLLDHYQHMSAFKGIERDCCVIMDKIKENLWHSMHTGMSTDKMNEYARLLVVLKENRQDLWNTYTTVQLDSLPNTASCDIKDVDTLTKQYLLPLDSVVSHFQVLFLSPPENDTVSVISLGQEDKEQAKICLLQHIQPFVDSIFDRMAAYVELKDESQPIEITQLLTDIYNVIATDTPSLSSVASIDSRLDGFISSWHSNLIDHLTQPTAWKLQKRIEEFSVKYLHVDTNSNNYSFIVPDENGLRDFLDDTVTWFCRYLKSNCFAVLQSCFKVTTKEHQSSFLSQIQAGLKDIWVAIAQYFTDLSGGKSPSPSSSAVLIFILSRLCYDFADHGIMHSYSDLSELFYASQFASPIHVGLMADANHMVERYLSIGQKLLNQQVMQDGYRLSTDVQRCYLEYDAIEPSSLLSSTSTSPSHVSDIWRRMLHQLKSLEHLIQTIFPHAVILAGQQGGISMTGNNSDSEYESRHESNLAASDDPYSVYENSTDHSLSTASNTFLGARKSANSNNGSKRNISFDVNHSNDTKGGNLRLLSKFEGGENEMTFNVLNNIDKLFAERVDIYRRVDPSSLSVCSGIMRIVIKSFHEAARQVQSIDEYTFKQLQLDVDFIQHSFWFYTTDEKWVSSMLQDIITGAYLRYRQPTSVTCLQTPTTTALEGGFPS